MQQILTINFLAMKRVVISVAFMLGLGLTQARESLPESASDKNASGAAKNTFTFISPGEGRYLYMFNEAFPEENNVIFKWSPKTADAVLLIQSGDEVLDEIRVKNTDHIKLCLSKYSAYRSLTWTLTVNDSDEVMEGSISLKKFLPPRLIDVKFVK